MTAVLNDLGAAETPNAGTVLAALRSHGWMISPDEQDAHELFHVLTTTMDDELKLLNKQALSLFDISWLDQTPNLNFSR